IEIVRKAAPPLVLSGVINQICDDRGKISGFLIVVSDVTEARREDTLKKNFLSLISHKLRTPLVAIRGFTPMLLEKPEELNSFQKTAIETIDRNSLQLTSIVDKLMWFAALEGDTLELLRKPSAVASVLDLSMTDLAAFLRANQVQIVRDDAIQALPQISV